MERKLSTRSPLSRLPFSLSLSVAADLESRIMTRTRSQQLKKKRHTTCCPLLHVGETETESETDRNEEGEKPPTSSPRRIDQLFGLRGCCSTDQIEKAGKHSFFKREKKMNIVRNLGEWERKMKSKKKRERRMFLCLEKKEEWTQGTIQDVSQQHEGLRNSAIPQCTHVLARRLARLFHLFFLLFYIY